MRSPHNPIAPFGGSRALPTSPCKSSQTCLVLRKRALTDRDIVGASSSTQEEILALRRPVYGTCGRGAVLARDGTNLPSFARARMVPRLHERLSRLPSTPPMCRGSKEYWPDQRNRTARGSLIGARYNHPDPCTSPAETEQREQSQQHTLSKQKWVASVRLRSPGTSALSKLGVRDDCHADPWFASRPAGTTDSSAVGPSSLASLNFEALPGGRSFKTYNVSRQRRVPPVGIPTA